MDSATTIPLHPLRWLEQDGEVIVARTDADCYGVFPPDGASLLRVLADGATMGEASRWYREEYGEQVDLGAFVSVLAELGFIRAPGEKPSAAAPGPLKMQRAGQILFSPPVAIAWAALLLVTIAVCAEYPSLLPRRGHAYWSGSLTVIELTLLVAQSVLTVTHEMSHLLAARRIGVRAKFNLSHRAFIPVVETVMDGLVAVPRKQRFLPLVAGMAADLTAFCLLTLLGFLLRGATGIPGAVGKLSLAIAFVAILKIAWQFYLFLRTDVYYLMVAALGCVNLRGVTRQWLRNRATRMLRRPPVYDESTWHDRDARVARWYAPLMFIGYVVALAVVFTAVIPVTWHLMRIAIDTLAATRREDAGRFWDAIGLLLINCSGLALGIGVAIYEWRTGRRRRQASPAPG